MEEATGTSEVFVFDAPIKFRDIKAKSSAKGKLEIMKLNGGVNAKLEEVEIEIGFECEKCLKEFSQRIIVPLAERQFLLEAPKKAKDPNDLFLIDKKHYTIDLTEPLRQELILHFPIIPVCSSGCQGICSMCGKERNKAKCSCKAQVPGDNKPLSALKELIKK